DKKGVLTINHIGELDRGKDTDLPGSIANEVIVRFSGIRQYTLRPPAQGRREGFCTGVELAELASSADQSTLDATPATSLSVAFDAVADDAVVGRADDAGANTNISSQAHSGTSKGKSVVATGQFADLEVQGIYSPDADIFDHFGYSISLSADGSTLAVGTPFDLERKPTAAALADPERGGHRSSGTVSVYERVGGQWAEKARLRPSDGFFDDEFGYSVSLSADGSTLAIGAPGTDPSTCQNKKRSSSVGGNESYVGAAYVFERSAAGRWTQHTCLDNNGEEATYRFGEKVTLSGDGQLLVINSDSKKREYKAVHVFERNSSNWLRGSAPKPPTKPPVGELYIHEDWGPAYAWSFAINNDGSVMAISAQAWNTVFVYTRDEPHALDGSDKSHTRGWQLSAVLEPPSSEIGKVARLGMSVSLNGAGDRLVATAAEKIHLYRPTDRGIKNCLKNCVKVDTSEDLPYYGLMAVYQMTADGDWGLQAQLRVTPLIPGYIELDGDSYTSAMSFDGDIVVVGGFGEDFLGRSFASIAGDGIPTIPTELRKKPVLPDRGYENVDWGRGFQPVQRYHEAAWLAVRKDGIWQKTPQLRPPAAPDANERDRFGLSVAIDAIGQTIAIGAPMRSAPITDNRPAPLKYSDGILQSGAAFIYIRPDTDE
nr:FG-GAP repeat protein [Pseudomonadota bacterium]